MRRRSCRCYRALNEIIDELPISDAEREAIFSGNALRLLGRAG